MKKFLGASAISFLFFQLISANSAPVFSLALTPLKTYQIPENNNENNAVSGIFYDYLVKISISGLPGIKLFYSPLESDVPGSPLTAFVISSNMPWWTPDFFGNYSYNLGKNPSPSQLFDIRLVLEKNIIETGDNMTISASFNNFGTIPTLINLTYSISNKGGTIYLAHDSITVQTQRVLLKSFNNLGLPEGNYAFTLSTLYDGNVSDNFVQYFSVVNSKKSLPDINLVIVELFIIAGFSVLCACIIYIIIKKQKKHFSRR